jgi:hypothetical protein
MGWETEIPDVITGEPIESAWGNEVRDKLVHIVASVAALPSDEPDGGLAYVQATNGLYLRRGSVWVPVPGGHLGTAETTANQTGLGAGTTDLTGLSVAVTVPAGRRLKISGLVAINQVNAGGVAGMFIRDEANNNLQRVRQTMAVNDIGFLYAQAVITPSAGAHTYKLSGTTSAGNLTIIGSASDRNQITVEDIGAA